MKDLYELKEKLCRELKEISRKPEMGAGDLELAHKLTDTIKNIDKICMMEESGYSEDGYGRGVSDANRGQHWVRGHYSRDGGRSEMMMHLKAALDSATEEYREDIRRFMRKLENV